MLLESRVKVNKNLALLTSESIKMSQWRWSGIKSNNITAEHRSRLHKKSRSQSQGVLNNDSTVKDTRNSLKIAHINYKL